MKIVKYLIFASSLIFVFTNNDFRKLIKNYFKLHKLKKQNITLDKEYADMKNEKQLLETDDEYLEKFARYQLHLTKPNEYEFRFTPPAKIK